MLNSGGLAWWGTIFILLVLYVYTKQIILDIEEEAVLSPVIDTDAVPFKLPRMQLKVSNFHRSCPPHRAHTGAEF